MISLRSRLGLVRMRGESGTAGGADGLIGCTGDTGVAAEADLIGNWVICGHDSRLHLPGMVLAWWSRLYDLFSQGLKPSS